MKYKLLKDTPDVNAGTVGEIQDDFFHFKNRFGKFNYGNATFHKDIVENNPDWFEPVIERWRAKHEGYYSVQGDDCIRLDYEIPTHDAIICANRQFDFGNYFRTYEQALEARRRIKKVLMDYHAEIGE